jgi:haloacetate dehalogenase
VGDLFPGFAARDVATRGARIHARVGGSGPPLLLLHGYPQTHAIWHRVAPRLAGRFTVVAADLRGHGDSAKPPSATDHAPYSKRAMAADQVEAMEAYERTDLAFALAYYHWFFLVQPEPLPERLIGAEPRFYLRAKLGSGCAGLAPFSPEAYAEYERCFDAEAVHASCEDYRASVGIDLAHDRADEERRVAAPLLALWGRDGVVHRCFDVLAAWRERATAVTGRPLESGHYIAEEVPDAFLAELLPHLEGARGGG